MRCLRTAGAAGLLALAACSDTGPAGTSQVEFAVSTRAAAAAPSTQFSASETYTDLSGDTLDIDSVFVVVRKLKLEGSAANMACIGDEGEIGDMMSMVSDTGDSHEAEDECGELKLGPFLVELPVGAGGAERQFVVTVDTGTYSEVKFQIHKPEGAGDADFLVAHPEYDGVSIRVVGRWNGTPFVFVTGVTDVQEVEFDPPLVVGEASVSFTLFVDLAGWFRAEDGSLVDPATALGDGVNTTLVHQNIIRSFHAFEDEDRDGQDDHSD